MNYPQLMIMNNFSLKLSNQDISKVNNEYQFYFPIEFKSSKTCEPRAKATIALEKQLQDDSNSLFYLIIIAPKDLETRSTTKPLHETITCILYQIYIEIIMEVMQYFSMDHYVDKYNKLIELFPKILYTSLCSLSTMAYMNLLNCLPDRSIMEYLCLIHQFFTNWIENSRFPNESFAHITTIAIITIIAMTPGLLLSYGFNNIEERRVIQIGEYFIRNRY